MIHFLDASALVKRYVREAGSDVVRALVRRRPALAASRISAIEVPAALARRARDGDVAEKAAKGHGARVGADMAAMTVVELRPNVATLASDLVWRHPLRAYDAVQLASALHLARATGSALTFWCADTRLCSIAAAEGLRTRDL